MLPGLQSTIAMDVKHFVSPSKEVRYREEEEVTFEKLLEPYQPLPIPEEDNPEVPLLKLYVQQ